jgi:hypothetical protein
VRLRYGNAMKTLRLLVVCNHVPSRLVLLFLWLMIPLYAGAVGINFTGPTAASSTLAPEVKAGMGRYQQNNWNNMTVTADDPNGHSNNGELQGVKDSRGRPVPGMKIRVGADRSTQLWPRDGADWGFKEGDAVLHKGMVYPQALIEISGIPYPLYDVILYSTSGTTGGRNSATIKKKSGSGAVDINSTYYDNFTWNNGQYAVATAKTPEAAKEGSVSNVIVFKGNTARHIIIEWDGKADHWSGLGGIQIVPSR